MMDQIETTYEMVGNKIHRIDVDGYESWSDLDINGKEIHCRDSNGYESWTERDSDGYEIHTKTNRGDEYWCHYTDDHDIMFIRFSDGNETILIQSKGVKITKHVDGSIDYCRDLDKRIIDPIPGITIDMCVRMIFESAKTMALYQKYVIPQMYDRDEYNKKPMEPNLSMIRKRRRSGK